MSNLITPQGFGANAVGLQNIRLGFDCSRTNITTTAASIGMLPANAVIKAARGTVITAEGGAGNFLLVHSVDGGTNTTTILTVDANGTAGTRTNAPTNIDAAAAVPTVGSLLDTGTSALYELMVKGSATLDAAQIIVDLEVYFGPTTGADGTGELSL